MASSSALRGVIDVGLRNLTRSAGNLAVGIVGFAAVMFLFSIMMATRQGLSNTVGQQIPATAVIIVRAGAPNEMFSVVTTADRETVQNNLRADHLDAGLSAEAVLPVTLPDATTGRTVTVPLRGLEKPEGGHRAHLVAGRWFSPGSNELTVGSRATEQLADASIGRTLRLGKLDWTVVGVFNADKTLFDGELWTDLNTVQGAYSRGSAVQSIYLDRPDATSIDTVRASVNQGSAGSFDVQPAREFFAGQLKFLQLYIDVAVTGLTVFMLVAVLFATISIMNSLIEGRLLQYQILNAIGYLRSSLAAGIALEGATIGVLGAAFGTALAALLFQSHELTTSIGVSYLVFQLDLSATTVALALAMAAIIGAVGAVAAAWKIVLRPGDLGGRPLL